ESFTMMLKPIVPFLPLPVRITNEYVAIDLHLSPHDAPGRRMLSALHCKSKHEHQERCATEDAANCMKPTPPLEEAACFFRAEVEFLTLQPFVGRQNHDKRQRNNQQEE